MSDREYNIDDMINAARQESPSEFQNAFADLMLDKIAAAVDAKRVEVAQQYFNYDQAGEDQSQEDDQTSEEQEDESNENTEATAGTEEA